MADKNYIVGGMSPVEPLSVRYRCTECGAEVYLSPGGQTHAMRGHVVLCVPCGFAKALADPTQRVIPLPYGG